MHYILDGNNIIKHPLWRTKERVDNRQSLLIYLKIYIRRHPSVFFTVVFDGWSEISSSHPGIKILWSCDDSADTLIIQKLHSLKQNAIVVSNDNEIRKSAKLQGFKVMKVEEFLQITDTTKQSQTERTSSKGTYSRILPIEKELQDYYEKKQVSSRIRKIRKKIQGFF